MHLNKKLASLLIIGLAIICYTTTSYATFTTGTGKHTFKIESFNAGTRLRLQSFLVGFGLSNQSSINFKLTQTNEVKDGEKPIMDFIVPSYKGIGVNHFYLEGPILDIGYQYIPRHPLFVTPDALNAIQVGLKTYRGNVISPKNNGIVQNLNKIYFIAGVLSRSRWENYNFFSSAKFAYDPDETGGWLFNSQIGLEVRIKGNVKGTISYKTIGSAVGSKQGISLGVRVHY
ncbi:hypothetical protein Halha_1024 [Halobacteroides halobius DSM 5150]|uniref:Outer membrane protein beta-barrel domain-containing protein n=1 Tax=Halobacteroides halobius (strain ATCC 35273 / DSM 5150 / MD-1) TaxID=748449 RepID=L0K8W3_HALHC|nr:hypothetical protein [Halobacteroides halobius]AGB40985.1 hypothetical protein Halha_1024 [Halobacteroides halobius DSM 5150]